MRTNKKQIQTLRKNRIRSKVSGTANRPRMNVFRSTNHIYVQLIDDEAGKTLAAASSKEIKTKATKASLASEVGKLAAQKAKSAGISEVVFDRGGNRYHGRIKSLAEAAREAGLKF
ncbi:MAG: 50S ribosomal protein L18 [Candidatus Doudnabacteria bacterium]|nr:50S ribosomal protein L18 [Candidatus Doudnabacteria bacterium]